MASSVSINIGQLYHARGKDRFGPRLHPWAARSPLAISSLQSFALSSTTASVRFFGTRGARGHGWYTLYRQGRGGRHLQGEYAEKGDNEVDKQVWNEAVLQLQDQRVYMDIQVQPKTTTVTTTVVEGTGAADDQEESTSSSSETHRIEVRLASGVLSETTRNFIELLPQYIGTKLYRIEKGVGWCGGDVVTNTGKTGRAAQTLLLQQQSTTSESSDASDKGQQKPTSPTSSTLLETSDPLVLWHLAGTVSFLSPTVNCVDSRFMLCTQDAPHLDGIHHAIGQVTPSSLQQLQQWQESLLTRKGVPTAYDLVVTDCGVLTTSSTDAAKVDSGESSSGQQQVQASS